jgi:hypothetical protein
MLPGLLASVAAWKVDDGTRRHCAPAPPRTARHGAQAPAHPEPRPGVTGAHVLTKAQLTHADLDAVAAFDMVRQIPQVADGIRCHCGCAGEPGYRSLLSCYEGDGMAQHCVICQGQGKLAFTLHQKGKSLKEIRAAIDKEYE